MGKDLKGNELGSCFSQRSDGRYCARFTDRFGIRKCLYNKSLKDLKRRYKDSVREDIARLNVKTEFTLDEWYEQWINVYKYKIRNNSRRHYIQVYTKHIKHVLGHKLLTKITSLDINALINDLDRQGYRYETKNKVKIILLDMFDKAIVDDFVYKNPARNIKIERDQFSDRRVLSQDEQTDFFDACKGTFYEELFIVAVLTGLRPGELCALRWQDIDLKN